jgi:hypothetical protein
MLLKLFRFRAASAKTRIIGTTTGGVGAPLLTIGALAGSLSLKNGFCGVEYLFGGALDRAHRPRLKDGYVGGLFGGIVG